VLLNDIRSTLALPCAFPSDKWLDFHNSTRPETGGDPTISVRHRLL